MENKKEIDRLVRGAPKLREEDLRQINSAYSAYIFRRRKTREVWCSCCGRHEVLDADSPVMLAKHMPEPKQEAHYYGCHAAMMAAPAPKRDPDPPKPVACPFCGRVSPVKEIGRIGKAKNLKDFRRVIVLRWWRGALWGLGYRTEKWYGGEDTLCKLPDTELIKIYRFVPGKAEYISRSYWYGGEFGYYHVLKDQALPRKWKFPDGFDFCNKYGDSYDLANLDEVDKSPLRYCGFADFQKSSGKSMKFLALCTVYPHQVEMLMKAGLEGIVRDFVEDGKLNAKVFSWNQQNPMKSFGLTKEEMQTWLTVGERDTQLLEVYKQFKKRGLQGSIEQLHALKRDIYTTFFERATVRMKRYGVGVQKLRNYLAKEKETSSTSWSNAAGWWCDYIDAAEKIGYDLQNAIFLLPKGLKKHHDKATKAALAVKKAVEAKEQKEKEENRCRTLTKKYTYSDGRWLIRPPVSAAEIVQEGKNLRHCVGGYAARHVNGTVTILFLRDRTRPGKSLITIEMRKNEIAQINGWDDERTVCPQNPHRKDPREIYAEFLDGWLAWLKAGSKRQKKPRKTNRKKEHAA